MKKIQAYSRRQRQSGFALLSALLALAIFAILTAGQIEAQQLQQRVTQGRLQGDVLNLVKDAANTYTMENYAALQSNLGVIKGTATLTSGTANGQTLAPAIADLIAMGYLPAGTSSVSQLNSGVYRISLSMVPAGCATSACNITGAVYIDQPIRQVGTTNIAGVVVGAIVDKVGGDVLVALQPNINYLTGINGMSLPNPLGSSEGVVGARVGFGASAFGRYLVVNDPRDPNFQGNLTLAKDLAIGGNSTFGGTVTVTGATTMSGPVTINANTILKNSQGNPCITLNQNGNAAINCLDPTDIPSGYNGGLRAYDVIASGNVLVTDSPRFFNGSNYQFARINSSGGSNQGVAEALIQTSGQVAADRIIPKGRYTPGSACSDAGAIAGSSDSASGGVLVVCSGSAWVGLSTIATAGASCSVAGQGAVDAQGRQLYCFNGIWNMMLDFLPPATPGGSCTTAGAVGYQVPMIGSGSTMSICRVNPTGGALRWFRIQDITTHLTFVTAYEVTNGSVVQKPTCEAASGQTATPLAYLEAKVESSSDGGFSRFTIDQGNSWLVQLTNGAGGALSASPSASAIMQIYCHML